MTLSYLIRSQREKLGYSQSYMALKLKINQPSYSKFEHEPEIHTIKRLFEICKLLNICEDEMFNLIKEKYIPNKIIQLDINLKSLDIKLNDILSKLNNGVT